MSKRLAVAVCALLLLGSLTAVVNPISATAAAAPTADVHKIVNLGSRQYLVYVPTSVKNPAPIMVVPHGVRMTMATQEAQTGFNALAKTSGWIVVYPGAFNEPNGPGDASFNGGPATCCGPAMEQGIDDLAYFKQVVADIDKTYPVDKTRINISGMSNGGYMAFRAACENADFYASASPVSGAVGVAACKPAVPISVLHIHGLADAVVNPRGGDSGLKAFADPQAAFAKQFGCTSGGTEITAAGVSITAATGCPTGIQLETDLLAGVGHDWSNAEGFNTSSKIWAFVQDKRRITATTSAPTTPPASTPPAGASTASLVVALAGTNAIVARGSNFTAAGTANVTFAFGTTAVTQNVPVDSSGRLVATALVPQGFTGTVTVTATVGTASVKKTIVVSVPVATTSPTTAVASPTSPATTPTLPPNVPTTAQPTTSVPPTATVITTTLLPTVPPTTQPLPSSPTLPPATQSPPPATTEPPASQSPPPAATPHTDVDRLRKLVAHFQELVKQLLKLFTSLFG